MGQQLESFCSNLEVTNAAIGGTTADEWAGTNSNILAECGPTKDWDIVYIAVGQNDLAYTGCSMSSSVLRSKIESAVENIVSNVAPGASKYVLTGECMPTEE